MITIEKTFEPDLNWNKRLETNSQGSIYHTTEYAYVQNDLNFKPIFLKFVNSTGNIVGQMLIVVRARSFSHSQLRFFKEILSSKNKILRWVYGPVIFDSQFTFEILESLIEFFKVQKKLFSGSEHPFSFGMFSKVKNNFKLNKWGTYIFNLSEGSDLLWSKMEKNSVKKNIERTKKRGIYAKEMKRTDLELYRKIRKETKPVSLSTLENRWDKLKKAGWTGFLAFENENPIGGIMVSHFNGFINEFGIARTKRDFIGKFYAQDLLKWTILEWGINKNLKYYDLTGVNPNPSNEKELGILRYKKKWGADFLSYYKITT